MHSFGAPLVAYLKEAVSAECITMAAFEHAPAPVMAYPMMPEKLYSPT